MGTGRQTGCASPKHICSETLNHRGDLEQTCASSSPGGAVRSQTNASLRWLCAWIAPWVSLIVGVQEVSIERYRKVEQIAALLEEVRDNHRTQLERQAESLAIQKEQFQGFLKQQEKASQLQDRAEAIQAKSSLLLEGVQRFVPVVMVVVVLLIGFVAWLLLRCIQW